MNRLFMLGALIGIGYGIFKFLKKDKKTEIQPEMQAQAS